MAFYQPKSRRIPEATDKRGEKIFEPKTHCEIGFALEALRSLCHVLLSREMAQFSIELILLVV